jgi:hypothetical protein
VGQQEKPIGWINLISFSDFNWLILFSDSNFSIEAISTSVQEHRESSGLIDFYLHLYSILSVGEQFSFLNIREVLGFDFIIA